MSLVQVSQGISYLLAFIFAICLISTWNKNEASNSLFLSVLLMVMLLIFLLSRFQLIKDSKADKKCHVIFLFAIPAFCVSCKLVNDLRILKNKSTEEIEYAMQNTDLKKLALASSLLTIFGAVTVTGIRWYFVKLEDQQTTLTKQTVNTTKNAPKLRYGPDGKLLIKNGNVVFEGEEYYQ